jgi:hypothetical protein
MVKDRAKELADRLDKFNEELISFVEKCTEADWSKIGKEGWPLGVTARHIGASHYQGIAAAKMIIEGAKLPEMTMEQITERANRHAREHAECTKSEVLDVLRRHGRTLVEFAEGLDDAKLDKSGYLPALGRALTVGRFLEDVILQGAKEHFESIRVAAGG